MDGGNRPTAILVKMLKESPWCVLGKKKTINFHVGSVTVTDVNHIHYHDKVLCQILYAKYEPPITCIMGTEELMGHHTIEIC